MTGRLLTAAQVAEMLGVPTTCVYEQSRRGSIPTVTLGRYRRYRAEAIAQWVEQQEADVPKVRFRRNIALALPGSGPDDAGAGARMLDCRLVKREN